MTRLALLVCATALLVSACGTSNHSSGPTEEGTAPELTSIQQLRESFDAHQDVPQLIVLISPT